MGLFSKIKNMFKSEKSESVELDDLKKEISIDDDVQKNNVSEKDNEKKEETTSVKVYEKGLTK